MAKGALIGFERAFSRKNPKLKGIAIANIRGFGDFGFPFTKVKRVR
jgi:hypothetical protein